MPDIDVVLASKFATVTLTGTDVHLINFDAVLDDKPGIVVYNGIANVELAGGTSVQLSPNTSIDDNSGKVVPDHPKAQIDIRKGMRLRAKGIAGGEVLYVSILSD